MPNAQVPQQDFIHTGNRLDLAVQGNGDFALQKPSGKRCFTRARRFVRSPTGQVTTPDGGPVLSFGEIRIPQQATNLTIASDGKVMVTQARTSKVVGQIKLFTIDGNTDMIYLATTASPFGTKPAETQPTRPVHPPSSPFTAPSTTVARRIG